jgi:hypothetical protein
MCPGAPADDGGSGYGIIASSLVAVSCGIVLDVARIVGRIDIMQVGFQILRSR